MAVIVQYIVVRNGVQKMTFVEKKKADAYDKMLDIAEKLFEFIDAADFNIENSVIEEISLYISENRKEIQSILRGVNMTGPKVDDTNSINTKKIKPIKSKLVTEPKETPSDNKNVS